MNKYKEQLKKLQLDNNLSEMDFFVAGGAIRSIFTNEQINDIDIYPKTYEDTYEILEYMKNNYTLLSCTDKSVMFYSSNHTYKYNIVTFREFNTAKDIFDSFDYTIVMGAYDNTNDEFIFHEDFFVDNTSRSLIFNKKTGYPVISLLRLYKYYDRGYKFNKITLIQIVSEILKLNITSWEDISEQFGGMYGLDISKVKDIPYSLDTFVTLIEESKLPIYDEYVQDNKYDEYYDKLINKLENQVCADYVKHCGLLLYKEYNKKRYYFEHIYNKTFKYSKYSDMLSRDTQYASEFELPAGSKLLLYKAVQENYKSIYHPAFKYSLTEDNIPLKDISHNGKLYLTLSIPLAYVGKERKIVTATANFSDILTLSDNEVVVSKCSPIKDL